jgi:hypothetical protein
MLVVGYSINYQHINFYRNFQIGYKKRGKKPLKVFSDKLIIFFLLKMSFPFFSFTQ